MRILFAAAVPLLAAGMALSQTHVPPVTPTPPLCPGMGGLEIGMDRGLAFQRMGRTEPGKPMSREVQVLHTPYRRPWVIEVTFDSESDDAKVVGLHYIIRPPSGLLDGLLERYEKGTPVPGESGVTYWDVPRCSVRIRYRAQLSEEQRPVAEEMWVEPISKPLAKGKKTASR